MFFFCRFLLCSDVDGVVPVVGNLYTYDENTYVLAPNQFVAYRIETLKRVDLLLAQIRSLVSTVDSSETLVLVDQQKNIIFEGSEIIGLYTFMTRDQSLFTNYLELKNLCAMVNGLTGYEEFIIPMITYDKNGFPVQDRKVVFKANSYGHIIGSSSSNQDNDNQRPIGFARFKQQDMNRVIKLK